MAILEVNNLGKSFGATEVLKDISFSLEKGESLAIIGSSGSGKTTLLRCLNFLETPNCGSIRVNGEVIFDSARAFDNLPPMVRRKSWGPGIVLDLNRFFAALLNGGMSPEAIRRNRLHFGLVFQSFNLFPQYTAFQNVVLASELLAKERPDYKANKKAILDDIHEKGRALLASVGLAAKADNYPHQLSGGQQQRVAIARALALNPDILCFDEPTSALDPELTGEVLNVIRSLAARNTTMIIVTHEMQFARQVADNVMFMDSGVVIEYGRAADVIDNPSQERTKRFLENYTNN